jgi:hypothetical protein
MAGDAFFKVAEVFASLCDEGFYHGIFFSHKTKKFKNLQSMEPLFNKATSFLDKELLSLN